jgi:GT2 family glycosyltransferase
METQAPAVVAIVVTADPDALLEATLVSLADQDYKALSTLVMINGGDESVARRVASADPAAFIARREGNDGFGAGVNEATEMVEGAQFFLICHDDVVLRPDAVHQLVEESFRSNAGIVTPKFVTVENHSILLHVGQGVDRFGTVVERVQPGEFDQGQHDIVRDVFVAPGGVVLIRGDLFSSLGGYDPRYLAFGEDIDLSWRAQIAGARIVCAPQAVVAHKERLTSGDRAPAAILALADVPSLARLVRRNKLRTLIKCWGLPQRILTLAMLIILDLGELVVAIFGRDVSRAVDIREAWRQWWRDRKQISGDRKKAFEIRMTSDRVIRANQVHGATRLRAFLTTLFHHGYDAARGAIAVEEESPEQSSTTASFGGAFSDDEGFDELDDLGKRARGSRQGRSKVSSARSVAFLGVVALLVYLIGSRDLIGSRLPLIGQFVPLGTWTDVWHHVFASWQSPGLGNGAPTQPGYAVLGLFGTLSLGHLGAIERLVLLGALPLGAWGVSRLIKPVASIRARLLSAIAFVGLGLGANAIAAGRISAMVALGAMPFVIKRVLRISGVVPFDEAFEPSVRIGTRGWRRTRQGAVFSLALLLALCGAIAPALLIVTVVVALGSALAGAVSGVGSAFRGFAQVIGAVILSLVLLFPLAITTVLSGWSGLSLFGAATGPWSNPGLGGLVRFAVGPNGGGALAWLLPAAALLPLLLARQRRFALATHLAGIGVLALALALFTSRGGWGAFAPDLMISLAPLATAIAAMVGLGLSAFEDDLADLRFSWRQIVGILGVAAALVGLLPIIGSAGNGRWKMPISGYNDSLSFLGGPSYVGHRVLWLGDPRAIPGSSWPLEPGLAWATSVGGLPGTSNLFVPPSATAAGAITAAIDQALHGDTVQLGRLLAPTGVQAIVVVSTIAPTLPGVQTGAPTPPPASLIPALDHQNDLVQEPGGGGAVVFEDPLAIAQFSSRSTPLASSADASSLLAVSGWSQVVGTTGTSGVIGSLQTTAFIGMAPSGDFTVTPSKSAPPSASAFGWAKTVSVTTGPASITLSAAPINALVQVLMVLGWVGLALLLIGRHRWLDWWWQRRRPTHSVEEDTQALLEEVIG